MSHEIVVTAARILVLTCVAVSILSGIFDESAIRDVRLMACGLVAVAGIGALWLLRRKHFGPAVLVLLVSLYAASAVGSIGTQTGLRAPSLMVLSMFSLICAFAFPRWLAVTCIGLNMGYLAVLLGLEKAGVIDPMGHLQALNSTSVFIVLVTLSAIFGVMGFPLGKQVDRAMRKMHDSRSSLGRSREMYRSLVEGAPIGIINFDANGLVTSVNPMLTEWLGQDSGHLLGLPAMNILQRPLPAAFELPDASPLRFDVRMESPDTRGETRWLSVTVSPFPHDHSGYRGGLALLLDETERKRSELQLIEAKEAAEQAAQAKSRFLRHMSHELRTPMTGILGSLGLVQDDRVSPEKRQRMLGLLDNSARTMLKLIDDILDTARLGDGRLELRRDRFCPHDFAVEANTLYRAAAEARGLEFNVNWLGETGLNCVGDPARLRQIIGVLTDNAVRFTDAGSVALGFELQRLGAGRALFRVTVRDTGIGLTDTQQAEMFKPFTELGLKRAENQRGAGLGLSIAKGLVDCMGGRIGLRSESARGSDFWFEVPLTVETNDSDERNVKALAVSAS